MNREVRITAPATVCAGLPAVVSALVYTVQQAGAWRGCQALLKVNQKGGFDCPSCAWPDPKHRSPFEFCENGARAVADEATTRRVDPEFFQRHPVAELEARTDHWLNAQGRLTHPMILRAGADRYEPLSWEEAFARVGAELRSLGSPDEAIFYTSGRTSNEAAFLWQLFARAFGTNNLPDCSNMCHESSGVGLGETIGIGKGTVTLEDFDRTDLVLVIGQNPGTNHPRMLTALQRAKRRGARIVSVNPLPEAGLARFRNPQDFLNPLAAPAALLGPGTLLADLHVPVRLNGDVAFLKGLMKELLAEEERRPGEVFDRAFLSSRTEGLEAFLQDLRAETWERIVEGAGVSRELIRQAAVHVASAPAMIVCWAMGLTQHRNAVANIQEIVNLVLLRGSVGRPGAGLCPVRGHSNVQGDRTVGIVERPRPEFLDALQREFGFEPPRRHGLNTVQAIRAMRDGRARVFLAMGGNFLSASPDTGVTAEALRRCSLTVQISTKLNRSHLVTGREALLLPCLGRTEVDPVGPVSVENSMGFVHPSRGGLEPASPHLRSEPAIVAGLARAALPESPVDWEGLAADYSRIRARLARVVPGFEDYEERLRKGFYLPNEPREGRFPTPSGRARFTVHPIPDEPLPEGWLLMMTIRSHDQFNTTVYGLDDRYRGIHGTRLVVLFNEEDMAETGLADGDLVDLHGEGGRVARGFRVVPYPIPRRMCATYFPEANVLVPLDRYAEGSETPASKSVPVRIEPTTDY